MFGNVSRGKKISIKISIPLIDFSNNDDTVDVQQKRV